MCVMCRNQCESIKHLFSECSFALNMYDQLSDTFDLSIRDWRRIVEEEKAHKWITSKGVSIKAQEVLLTAMFIIWRERCSRIFKDITKSMEDLIEEVLEQWKFSHHHDH